jgi:His/Glu/Gln/Arg/opine family amino acid ABC transporter permease subunit
MLDSFLAQALYRGLKTTLELIAISAPLAVVLGISLGLMRVYLPRWPRLLLDGFVDFVRGIPFLLLLFIATYGLPDIGIYLTPIQAAVASLVINSGCYMSEYIKNSVLNLNSLDVLAARSLGFTRRQEIIYVVLPKSIPSSIQPIISETVYLAQNSTLASLVGVYEVYSSMKTYISYSFETLQPFLALTGIFVFISLGLRTVGQMIEKQYKTKK